MHGRYATDILKMCMKKFNTEKIFFTNLQGLICTLRGLYCKPFVTFVHSINADQHQLELIINQIFSSTHQQ